MEVAVWAGLYLQVRRSVLTVLELRDWCLWQMMNTTYGQSSGSMVTPAA